MKRIARYLIIATVALALSTPAFGQLLMLTNPPIVTPCSPMTRMLVYFNPVLNFFGFGGYSNPQCYM